MAALLQILSRETRSLYKHDVSWAAHHIDTKWDATVGHPVSDTVDTDDLIEGVLPAHDTRRVNGRTCQRSLPTSWRAIHTPVQAPYSLGLEMHSSDLIHHASRDTNLSSVSGLHTTLGRMCNKADTSICASRQTD